MKDKWYANKKDPLDLIYVSPKGRVITGTRSELQTEGNFWLPEDIEDSYEPVTDFNSHFARLGHDEISDILQSQLAQIINAE